MRASIESARDNRFRTRRAVALDAAGLPRTSHHDDADLAAGRSCDFPILICVGRSIDQPIAWEEVEAFEFKRRELRQIVFAGEIFSRGLEDRVEAQRVGARFELRRGKAA